LSVATDSHHKRTIPLTLTYRVGSEQRSGWLCRFKQLNGLEEQLTSGKVVVLKNTPTTKCPVASQLENLEEDSL